mgnify:CR=1 FL=1|jgi:hypothetical protein
MTNFESTSCKILGVILFLLIVIMGLQLMGCNPPHTDYIDEVKMENFA